MKTLRYVTILFILFCPLCILGQTKGAIKQAIQEKYPLAQATNDHKDLTAPGAVIDLLKDDFAISTTGVLVNDNDGNPLYASMPVSTYKNGKFQRSAMGKFMSGDRKLVAGEKCWLIGVEIRDDAAVLEFLTDPLDGVRFKGSIKYPFPKGQIPAADVVLDQIAQTIKAEPVQTASVNPPPAVAAPASAPAAMAPIPPPPPPDAPAAPPKTISLGQSKAQVIATFGSPAKVVVLPTKEIDFYPDMKVTFVKGKVSDVQ